MGSKTVKTFVAIPHSQTERTSRFIRGSLRQVESHLLLDYTIRPATVEDGRDMPIADIEDATGEPT